MDAQRRKARVAQIIHPRARQAQRVHQIADGAFVHARHAVQMVVAAQNRQRGGERAKRRARVAQKQIGLAHGERAAAALDFQAA